MLTREDTGHISPDLLDKLLLALKPIGLSETSTLFHIGYLAAQRDFKDVLTIRLNRGVLPSPTPTRLWWQLWK